MHRLLSMCIEHMTCKKLELRWFEKTPTPPLSALASSRTTVLGWDFLVLLFFSQSVHQVFWEHRPNILKVDTANGTFSIYFIQDCQASVSLLNNAHCFMQPFVCKPCLWETGQCATSSIMFTSVGEGFPCCTCPVQFRDVSDLRRAASSTASLL